MRIFSLLFLVFLSISSTQASSHREAPFIANNPAVDATDLYAFTSYETGRSDFITIIANYSPLQDTASGPNYYLFDPAALYEIKIDNDGDAREELTFRFRFKQELINSGRGLKVAVDNKNIDIPFINDSSFSAADSSGLNRELSYTVELIRKNAFSYGSNFNQIKSGKFLKQANNKTFFMPEYNIGSSSVADYDSYSSSFIYNVDVPGKNKNKCQTQAKVFAGARKESFKANLSGIYDLVNKDLSAAEDSAANEFNGTVLSIAIEFPKECLSKKEDTPVIGVWTTASLPARRIIRGQTSFKNPESTTVRDFVQVSRLGSPFVNQMLIGYSEKNSFNQNIPRKDKALFEEFIEYPALAEIIEDNSSLTAPNLFPRTDMEDIFLSGIENLNQLSSVRNSEMLRLNTATAVVETSAQDRLGVLGGDDAGFPNGRRPGDDVTDIFFRILMGARLTDSQAPSGSLSLTDGVLTDAADYDESFPYLLSP